MAASSVAWAASSIKTPAKANLEKKSPPGKSWGASCCLFLLFFGEREGRFLAVVFCAFFWGGVGFPSSSFFCGGGLGVEGVEGVEG